MFYNDRKKKAFEALEKAANQCKHLGEVTNQKVLALYDLRKCCAIAINNVEAYLLVLADSPEQYSKDVEESQKDIQEFNNAVQIELDYEKNGSEIAKISPSMAMSIATLFGDVHTNFFANNLITGGPNAFGLINLSFGTIGIMEAAGFGSVIGGTGLVAIGRGLIAGLLSGPGGWILLLGGGLLSMGKNKRAAEEAERKLEELRPIIADMERKLQELKNLHADTMKLLPAIDISKVCKNFPTKYCNFTDDQKLKLGALINSTKAMAKLINRRII